MKSCILCFSVGVRGEQHNKRSFHEICERELRVERNGTSKHVGKNREQYVMPKTSSLRARRDGTTLEKYCIRGRRRGQREFLHIFTAAAHLPKKTRSYVDVAETNTKFVRSLVPDSDLNYAAAKACEEFMSIFHVAKSLVTAWLVRSYISHILKIIVGPMNSGVASPTHLKEKDT